MLSSIPGYSRLFCGSRESGGGGGLVHFISPFAVPQLDVVVAGKRGGGNTHFLQGSPGGQAPVKAVDITNHPAMIRPKAATGMPPTQPTGPAGNCSILS